MQEVVGSIPIGSTTKRKSFRSEFNTGEVSLWDAVDTRIDHCGHLTDTVPAARMTSSAPKSGMTSIPACGSSIATGGEFLAQLTTGKRRYAKVRQFRLS